MTLSPFQRLVQVFIEFQCYLWLSSMLKLYKDKNFKILSINETWVKKFCVILLIIALKCEVF